MKRYTTEKQILDAIDAAKVRANELLKESEEKSTDGKKLAKLASRLCGENRDDALADSKWAFDQALRLAKSSDNIMDKKLKKLKKLGMKLAQFRTTPAPFINGAKGVGDASVSQNLSDL